MIAEWSPSDEYDRVEAASLVPDHPNVWTDGSLVLDRVTGVSYQLEHFFWRGCRWGHVDGDNDVSSCRGFCSVPGPLQSVQRAEMWCVILALQSSGAVHLGVDNLGVVRHVGRLLGGSHGSPPFELVMLIKRVLHLRGLDTVRITELRGMLMTLWFLMVGLGRMIGWVTTLLMRLQTLVVGGLVMLSSMHVVICLRFVVAGILFSLIIIGSSLPFLELCSIMMVTMVLLLIL